MNLFRAFLGETFKNEGPLSNFDLISFNFVETFVSDINFSGEDNEKFTLTDMIPKKELNSSDHLDY